MLSLIRFFTLSSLLWLVAGCDSKPGKPYPLDTCPVSGNKLGAHGDPYVFTHDGQEVKLCCEACLDEFNENAAKLMAEIASKAKPKAP
jgi:hypothetical protein